MSDDYQVPEGYVNPVPDPDEKKPKPWAGWSMSESGPFSALSVGRLLAGVAFLVFIFSDQIWGFAGDQIQQALDSLETWLESQ